MKPLAILLALAGSLPLGAQAADGSIQLGASHSGARGYTQTLWLQGEFNPRPWGRWEWRPVASVGWIPGSNGRSAYEDDVWLAGGGGRLRWRHDDGQPGRFFLEGQLLGASGRTDAISGPVQFASAAGWSNGRWDVILRHVSNAGTKGANRGETMLLVGRRF